MRQILFTIIVLLTGWVSLFGQDTYSNITDLYGRSSDLVWSLATVNNQVYTTIGNRCIGSSVDCAALGKIDIESGDTIWTNRVPWLDPGPRSLDYRGDTIEMSGHDYLERSKFYLHRRSLSGDSLQTFDLIPPDSIYALSIGGNITYGDRSIVFGNCRRIDTDDIPGILFWVNQTGVVDTVMLIEYGSEENQIFDADIGPDGLLTVLIDFKEWTEGPFPFIIRRKKLAKYNQQMEEVWSWQTGDEYIFSDQHPSCLEILADGTMIIVSENGSLLEEAIWGVNEQGIKWKYNFPLGGSNRFIVTNLSVAENGDILGCGQILDALIFEGQTGYIFRMSPTGEMLWERAIIDNAHEIPGQSNIGRFRDIVELEDGSLLAGGYQPVWYKNSQGQDVSNWDLWIVHTDANGCIIEDCDYVQDIPTSVPVIPDATKIQFYPNPASDIINVTWLKDLEIRQITLFNAHGQALHSIETDNHSVVIPIDQFTTGLYYVTIQDLDGRIYTDKVIISH